MKWYKSLPLVIAAGAALAGGCSNNKIQGEVIYENINLQTRCESVTSGARYILLLKNEDKFVREITLGGKPCLLSSLEKEVELGDKVILSGDNVVDWMDRTNNYVELKEYKVIKSKK